MTKQNGKAKSKGVKLAKDWFRIGADELDFAKAGFEDIGAFYPQICFLCQQAAEKYLKGFLTYHNVPFPKIHDLTALVKMCAKIDDAFPELMGDASVLSQYYLVVRYPLEYKEAGKNEAKEALAIANKIKEFVENCL